MINRVISVISEFTADFTNFTSIKFYIFGYIGEKNTVVSNKNMQSRFCFAYFGFYLLIVSLQLFQEV